MNYREYPAHTPSFRRHGPYDTGMTSSRLFVQGSPALAPSYGRTLNQQNLYNSYESRSVNGQYAPSSSIPYPYTSHYPVTSQYPVTYQYSSPYNPPQYHIPQPIPALCSPQVAELPVNSGFVVSPRGLETILIAILILVALDLIIVRPKKLLIVQP